MEAYLSKLYSQRYYFLYKLAPVFIFLFIYLNAAIAETSKSIPVFNYPVEAIYLINNPKTGEIAFGHSYKDACVMLGDNFFWGIVPSRSDTPACYSVNSYNMIIGADTWFCADGSISYFNIPHNFCNDYLTCADESWKLSDDKLVCNRKDLPCIPDPANVSEEQMLAALTYGESHWSNDYKEMAAIASAALRRMQAKRYKSINDMVMRDKNFSYATDPKSNNERYYLVMCGVNSPGVDLAYLAARNALEGGEDYSNGACFWDGIDLKKNGPNAYRYKAGFKISDEKHNILQVVEPAPLKRRGKNGKYFEYAYISTAGINKTIFWKYSKQALEAGETQCH